MVVDQPSEESKVLIDSVADETLSLEDVRCEHFKRLIHDIHQFYLIFIILMCEYLNA